MEESKKPAAGKGDDAQEKKDSTLEKIEDTDEFLHRFRSLYNSENFSDIILRVGDHRYFAHKLLLITASEVFEAMLSESRWQESSQPEVSLTEDEECVPVFPIFLKYIYSGSVELTTSIVHKLLILADKYGIHVLHKTCMDYMSRHIVESPDSNRTLTWYHYAKITNSQHLREKCLEFILSNFKIIQQAPDWLDLTPGVMVEFLQSSDIVVESEFKLWTGVEKWILADESDVKEKLQAVLPCIRFTMMPPTDLLNIEKSSLYNDHTEMFGNRIMNAYRRHSLNCSDLISQALEEPYRNYSHPIYRICEDLKLAHYVDVPKTESYINTAMIIPLHFQPFSTTANKGDDTSFEVAFYPQGFYQAHPLYGMYLSRQSDKTLLKVLGCDYKSDMDVDIALVIFAFRNNIKYIAHCCKISHRFSKEARQCRIEDVVPIASLKSKNAPYLVGRNFVAKIFVKIQKVIEKE